MGVQIGFCCLRECRHQNRVLGGEPRQRVLLADDFFWTDPSQSLRQGDWVSMRVKQPSGRVRCVHVVVK